MLRSTVSCLRNIASFRNLATTSGFNRNNFGTRNEEEQRIIRLFRNGDYGAAITSFLHRPLSERSDALNEAAILACAQVPDAMAAEAILNSMPRPTHAAIASVVTALCRERSVHAAIDVLEHVTRRGLYVDDRLVASVSRVAHRFKAPNVSTRLAALEICTTRVDGSLSPAGFFVEEGAPLSEWDVSTKSRPRPQHIVQKLVRTERRLRDSRGDVASVDAIWRDVCKDPILCTEVGPLSAVVDALLTRGDEGIALAVNTLMTWVQERLYDSETGGGLQRYTSNRSAMALLLTATTKALAAAAPTHPELALSAYDVLSEMRLPLFSSSLPLTGTYFKILQHAQLPLIETRSRIDRAHCNHVQLDEQAFSMALGAILRCDARVAEKLEKARLWVALMTSAGIPLTVHTFNLFAGQIRYCNDPKLISSLLADMRDAEVRPTAVTYGLIFGACVVQGDYCSPARRGTLPATTWTEVLEAMQDHMKTTGVSHTPYSLLALARSYAHLGLSARACEEFDAFVTSIAHVKMRNEQLWKNQLQEAYGQMIFNLAHCRDCSAQGPDSALVLFRQMVEMGLESSGEIFDSLLVAFVRLGKAQDAVKLAVEFVQNRHDIRISLIGMKHLLKAHANLQNPVMWNASIPVISANQELLLYPELKITIEGLVIRFARAGQQEICDELIKMTGVRIPGLELIFKGMDFSRFRARTLENEDTSVLPLRGNARMVTSTPVENGTEQGTQNRAPPLPHQTVPLM